MKTVLLATSALVALAGAASAEVAVSGDARIGLRYEDNAICLDTNGNGVIDAGDPACNDGGWNVVNRARVKFTMTGETDSGLSFGASFRVHEGDSARGAATNSRLSTGTGEVWVKGSYGTLRAGDVDSAVEAAVGDLPEVGLTGLNYYNEFFFEQSGVQDDVDGYGDDAVLRYEYTFNNATFYASFQDQYLGYSTSERGSAWSLGLGYEAGNYTFGIGYEQAEYAYLPVLGFSSNDSSTWALSGGTSINGITVKAIYANTNVDGEIGTVYTTDTDLVQYGLGAEYKMANGIGLGGFWRHWDLKADGADTVKSDMYGIGASYDLGGGAVVKGGIARANYNDAGNAIGLEDDTVADFGLALSF